MIKKTTTTETTDLESIGGVGWGVTQSDVVYCSAYHTVLGVSQEQEPVLFNFILNSHIECLLGPKELMIWQGRTVVS